MAKTTSTERMRKVRARLDNIAKKHGYKTWARLSTAVLRGELIIVRADSYDLSKNADT